MSSGGPVQYAPPALPLVGPDTKPPANASFTAAQAADYKNGAMAGYCQGLNAGRMVGEADGRNTSSAHADPNYPRFFMDRLDASGSQPFAPKPPFNLGFVINLRWGYDDGYAFGNAMGRASADLALAALYNDPAAVAEANDRLQGAMDEFIKLSDQYCQVPMVSAPGQSQGQSALAQTQAEGSGYPPDVVDQIREMWSEAQAEGYVQASTGAIAASTADVGAVATQLAALVGEAPAPIAQAANEAAASAERDAQASQGLAAASGQDAQAEAKKADSAAA
ncbi:MAG: hypothetical protein JRM90_01325 [Nitrososphaerota archaeon]|nr:hypothetical protein [Nitrososphaerota archaeon]